MSELEALFDCMCTKVRVAQLGGLPPLLASAKKESFSFPFGQGLLNSQNAFLVPPRFDVSRGAQMIGAVEQNAVVLL